MNSFKEKRICLTFSQLSYVVNFEIISSKYCLKSLKIVNIFAAILAFSDFY